MELQRYASIMIRESEKLLRLTGEYDAGAYNDLAIREQITNMKETLLNLAAQLPAKDEKDGLYINL